MEEPPAVIVSNSCINACPPPMTDAEAIVIGVYLLVVLGMSFTGLVMALWPIYRDWRWRKKRRW